MRGLSSSTSTVITKGLLDDIKVGLRGVDSPTSEASSPSKDAPDALPLGPPGLIVSDIDGKDLRLDNLPGITELMGFVEMSSISKCTSLADNTA